MISSSLFNDPKCLQDTLNMIGQNLFRSLPDASNLVHTGGDDDDDSEVDDQSCGGTMSFTVDEKDFNIVVESLKQQLGIEKVRISYMTRLCILAARKRLVPAEREEKVVKVQNIDGVELLRRVNETAASLIQSGNIEKIMEFLER